MDNNQERTLAYTMARSLSHEELEEVSAGNKVGQTFKHTNASVMFEGGARAQFDVTWDF